MPYGKRSYRKGKSLSKKVKGIVRSMSETKCRYSALAIDAAVSTDGNAVAVCQIPQGVNGDQRIGSTVQLRRLKISGQLTTMNGNNSNNPPPDVSVRLMLFYSAGEQFTQADLGDYLTGAYDPKRFFPLHDKYYNVPLDYVGQDGSGNNLVRPRMRTFTINKKLKYFQKYTRPIVTGKQSFGIISPC